MTTAGKSKQEGQTDQAALGRSNNGSRVIIISSGLPRC